MSYRIPSELLRQELETLHEITDETLALWGMRMVVEQQRPDGCVEYDFGQTTSFAAARVGLNEQLKIPDDPLFATGIIDVSARIHIPPQTLCYHPGLARFSTTVGMLYIGEDPTDSCLRQVAVATLETSSYVDYMPGHKYVSVGGDSRVAAKVFNEVRPGDSLSSYRPHTRKCSNFSADPATPNTGLAALHPAIQVGLHGDLGEFLISDLPVVIDQRYKIDS